eukprot:TRINITY_DN39_c1_g1_i1.p1 TRINITY_DN39_c1_g1~~TRINITY_DN39_c1_g1_i1.p1  ORF type:complete len:520 (+),score=243.04 TRINITY_DN39_c1_g1_i1:73-1632(+)
MATVNDSIVSARASLEEEIAAFEAVLGSKVSEQEFNEYHERKLDSLKTFYESELRDFPEDEEQAPVPEAAAVEVDEDAALEAEARKQIEEEEAIEAAAQAALAAEEEVTDEAVAEEVAEVAAEADIEAQVAEAEAEAAQAEADAQVEAEAQAQVEAEMAAEAAAAEAAAAADAAQAETDAAVEAEAQKQLENEAAAEAAAAAAEAEAEAEAAAAEAAAAAAAQLQAETEAAEAAAAAEAEAEAKAKAEAEAKAEADAKAAAVAEAGSAAESNPAPAATAPSGGSSMSGASAALEREKLEATTRIPLRPGSRGADIRDPAILETYLEMRDDNHSTKWMILGYKANSKNVLEVAAKGDGQWDEFVAAIPDSSCFMYINYSFGDSNRSKFVFLTYVPDTLGGMAKSRIVGHRPAIYKFIKYAQIQWDALDLADFTEEALKQKLLKAGGANYSVQESDKGNFSNYKKTTKQFYSETEKQGDGKAVSYSDGPLSTTPVDISGRPTVASPTSFLANTSADFKGKK